MSQKIEYIAVKNFKGIKELEVSNLSRFVAVFGKNGAGKTSFIEAIKSAIKADRGINSKVRIGEDKGEIEVKFEDFVIKRIVGDGGKLIVEHNGELVKQPQAWLDGVFKGTIGDPQKFINLHNKEKIKYLLETQGKKLEYDELEKQREVKFDERTNLHRTYLAKKEEVEKTDTSAFEVLESASVDTSELQQKLKEAETHNAGWHELKARVEKGDALLEQTNSEIKAIGESIETIDRQIEALQKKKAEAEKSMTEKLEYLDKVACQLADVRNQYESFEKIDTTEILAQLESHNQSLAKNAEIKAKKELYNQQVQARNELQAQWKELDNMVKAIEEQQNDLIKDLNLSYQLKLEEGIMYVFVHENRIPLDELNTAQQLEIGVDICLSGPNEIKIITIENANALDPNTLERVREKIESNQAQCFLETVYSTGYDEIVIEDWTLALKAE